MQRAKPAPRSSRVAQRHAYDGAPTNGLGLAVSAIECDAYDPLGRMWTAFEFLRVIVRGTFPARGSEPIETLEVGSTMKAKAAIAFAAGKPLEIVTVDLAGPKDGEVLVEIKASGVCHTDEFTCSGADPEGLFPVILGHEGAGVVVDVGRGVTTLKKGDHVIPLYTPE